MTRYVLHPKSRRGELGYSISSGLGREEGGGKAGGEGKGKEKRRD